MGCSERRYHSGSSHVKYRNHVLRDFTVKEVAQSQPTSKRLSSLEAWLDSIEGAVGTYVGDFTIPLPLKIKTDDHQNAGQYTIM